MSRKGRRAKEGADDRAGRQSDAAPVPSAQTGVRAPDACWSFAVCGLLILAVGLVFGKTVTYDFVNYDDDKFVYDNPMVARGVTMQGLGWAFTTDTGGVAYPLTWISYMLDSQIFGTKPWGYHLTNVLLHAATAVILFLTLRRMTGNLWASTLVALLFAVHPLRAEAVAWVGERKGPLSGLFFVATIAAYAAYARRPFSLARYLAVAGLFILALLAKPNLVTLPFVLLLLDYWPLGRWQGAGGGEQGAGSREREREAGGTNNACATASLAWLVVEKIPLLLVSVGGSVAAVLSQVRVGNIASLTRVSISARIANALVSYAVYLRQFFWPAGLAAYYPGSEDLPAWQVAGAFLVLAALSAAALVAWRKQPAVLVGWLWYLGTLVPMIGLVQIGTHARADRYTYLPQIGLSITVVWGTYWGLERLWGDWPARRWFYGVAGTLLVGALIACAWQQTSYWHDSEHLWTHALECTSNNSTAHDELGIALNSRGRFAEAIDEFRQALAIKPDYLSAHLNLGLALANHGQFAEAIDQYLYVLAIKPDDVKAHNNLGIALIHYGRYTEAIDHLREALAIKPDYVERPQQPRHRLEPFSTVR